MEKTVRSATFEELWRSRLPDFRATNEIRNLKRKGIEVEIVRKDDKVITLRAIAKSIEDIRYLFTRGYDKVPEKFEIKEFSDVVEPSSCAREPAPAEASRSPEAKSQCYS